MSFSPTLGRWLEADPIRYRAGDPNLYRFVGNDPVSRVDPSGLQEEKPAISVAEEEANGNFKRCSSKE